VEWHGTDEETSALLELALAARRAAHAPYSGFTVGAAVRLQDGTVCAGCNVENASFGLSICAERSAIFQAVNQRGATPAAAVRTAIVALALVLDAAPPGTPCGACRQVLAEFANPDCRIYCANLAGAVRCFTLGELLPQPFQLDR
jgi:homotetrameric cytidine deaminase